MSARDRAFDEAQRLVVHENLSYADAAERTGIPVSSIQKRAAAEQWQARRDGGMDYRASVGRMKRLALEAAMASLTPGADRTGDPATLIHAWGAIERTFPEHRYGAQEEDPKVKLTILNEVFEGFVAYLADADPNALTTITPHFRGVAAHLMKVWGA